SDLAVFEPAAATAVDEHGLTEEQPDVVLGEFTANVEPGDGESIVHRSLLRDTRPWAVTGGYPAKPFIVLLLAGALTEVDIRVFAVLGPEIKDYFGLDLSAIGALISVASVLALLVALPVGYFVDRVRRTRLAAGGAIATGVFATLTGLMPGVVLLTFARIGSTLGIASLMGFLYDEKFHVGPGGRGFFGGLVEPAGMLGVAIGGLITNRLMRFRPGRALTYAGLLGVVSGFMYVGVALSPWLW